MRSGGHRECSLHAHRERFGVMQRAWSELTDDALNLLMRGAGTLTSLPSATSHSPTVVHALCGALRLAIPSVGCGWNHTGTKPHLQYASSLWRQSVRTRMPLPCTLPGACLTQDSDRGSHRAWRFTRVVKIRGQCCRTQDRTPWEEAIQHSDDSLRLSEAAGDLSPKHVYHQNILQAGVCWGSGKSHGLHHSRS